MSRQELAKELTVAFLQSKPGSIHSIDDAVLVYEKFFEAVNRSNSVGEFGYIEPDNFIRNTEE
ncbi:hypothetical protein P3F89_27345 (plasmid) [Bacillus tropicus]|uniref:Uncharacterized protein n=1 Tax=Bacillus tropicus TaxID=2026188 RepID=A0ABD7ZZC5_9BACI|nr:hypothetical protein [Bacillus tropicus]WMY18238.1 hypothetical protein P3F89_27345 [Bacillus tropicus]